MAALGSGRAVSDRMRLLAASEERRVIARVAARKPWEPFAANAAISIVELLAGARMAGADQVGAGGADACIPSVRDLRNARVRSIV